jgi:4-deoxy-L-threo-5-hexosulose-uronate ketol-isomerase
MFSDVVKWIPRPQDVVLMNTEQLRDAFLVPDVFGAGELRGVFTGLDRLVVGGAMPLQPLELPNHKKTGRAFFLERRELGAINIGGPGAVHVDGQMFSLGRLDCVYVPMGTRKVIFESARAADPAQFYFLSCPAHAAYPAAAMKKEDATRAALGTQASAAAFRAASSSWASLNWRRAASGIRSRPTRTTGAQRSTSISI